MTHMTPPPIIDVQHARPIQLKREVPSYASCPPLDAPFWHARHAPTDDKIIHPPRTVSFRFLVPRWPILVGLAADSLSDVQPL
jgi:hypothetical protein